LVADIVGFSRLAGADEDRILARLRTLRSDLTDPTIAVHHGRIVKRTGDGTIVEFRSVVDAVRCAIEVQNGLAERNAGLPPERRIEFRVGIHLGDVVEESDGDLMGDGVNVAARLEGICEPGGLCLSEDAWRQVRDKLQEAFVDLGERKLKNIARPVRAYALSEAQIAASGLASPASKRSKRRGRWASMSVLVAALAVVVIAVGAYAWRSGLTSRLLGLSVAEDKLTTAPHLSIVVLPFENLSGDPEQEYFADGITDDLTTDLSHLADSFVISRGTAFTYQGKPVEAKQIGHDLGVRYVLEGSVREVGQTITVNAQLISTDTGAHVWADRFDGERSKLGELQVEVVARLANSLGVELVRAEAFRAARELSSNPDAVDLAMRGRAILYSQPDKAALKDAESLFERALAIDAQNVPALEGLARTLTLRVSLFWSENPAGDLARAEETIDRALSLQPQNSSAHAAKAWLLSVKPPRRYPQAIAEAEAAIADDNNNADAHARAGFWKMFIGHSEDGFAGVETALRLSPRDPSVWNWQYFICHLHAHLAQWEQAIEWCRKAITGNPKNWYTYVDLAAANAWAGHEKEAREAAAQLQELYPGFTVQTWAGIHWTENATFNAQYARIVEGLRKAGVPEGEAKTN
jgi:TolB-like protein/class 3 adenylate cyclase/Tfp pilus assembly protein PilF